MDAWLLLQDFEGNGERNRVLYVIKARGMAHSNQVREFLISNRGIDLVDAYIGPSGVLTGSARAAQTAREKAEALAGQQEAARRKRELERTRLALERPFPFAMIDAEVIVRCLCFDARRSRVHAVSAASQSFQTGS